MSPLRFVPFIILRTTVQLVGRISGSAQSISNDDSEILYATLSGSIRIERNGEKASVVSVEDPTQRAEIPPLEGISPVDDEYHSSPNNEWIFGVRRMAHGFSNGDLFHRVDSQHVEIAPTREGQAFNDRVWPYCIKQGALKANYSKEEEGADVGMTDVRWASILCLSFG